LSFIKTYLDIIITESSPIMAVMPEDLGLAELLADINIDCFVDITKDGANRLGDRAGYTITAVAVQLHVLHEVALGRLPPRLSETERSRLVVSLDTLLRRAEQDYVDYERGQRDSCEKRDDRAMCDAFSFVEPSLSRQLRSVRARLDAVRSL
jgi:hypothetical protein